MSSGVRTAKDNGEPVKGGTLVYGLEADTANAAGDLKVKDRDYPSSNRLWSTAARYMRASQAIGSGKSTNPEDYGLIAMAWSKVQNMRLKEASKK